MRVLPDVLAGEHEIPSESLLQSRVEFIAPSRSQWSGLSCLEATQQGVEHSVIATDAGEDQILIERRFQHARVRNTQHRIRRFYVVSDSQARFTLFVGSKPVVKITPHSEVENPVSLCDVVFQIKRELFYVRVAIEPVKSSAA